MRLSLKLLLFVALIVIASLLAGIITGPLGAQFLGTKPILPTPKIHLPADTVFHLGPIPVKNTVLASWITIAFLAGFFYAATRRMKVVPGKLQTVAETVVELLFNLVKGVVGEERARPIFPLVATIFLLVGFNAWLSTLPVYGTIGYLDEHGVVEKALLRNANTDLNQPLAIALIAVFAAEYWGMRSLGFRYLKQFVNINFGTLIPRPFSLMGLLVGVIQFVVQFLIGIIELLSHFIRLISFTFRLFGNMTAGKSLLLIVVFLVPFFFLGVDFIYILEILIGFVQALIFAGLTLVFSAIAITPHEGEQH